MKRDEERRFNEKDMDYQRFLIASNPQLWNSMYGDGKYEQIEAETPDLAPGTSLEEIKEIMEGFRKSQPD